MTAARASRVRRARRRRLAGTSPVRKVPGHGWSVARSTSDSNACPRTLRGPEAPSVNEGDDVDRDEQIDLFDWNSPIEFSPIDSHRHDTVDVRIEYICRYDGLLASLRGAFSDTHSDHLQL